MIVATACHAFATKTHGAVATYPIAVARARVIIFVAYTSCGMTVPWQTPPGRGNPGLLFLHRRPRPPANRDDGHSDSLKHAIRGGDIGMLIAPSASVAGLIGAAPETSWAQRSAQSAVAIAIAGLARWPARRDVSRVPFMGIRSARRWV